MSSEEEIDSPLGEEPLAATANGRVSGEDEDQIDQEELADLFGEGENGEGDPGKRQLDDEDLDSGDDEERDDRAEQDDEEVPKEVLNIIDIEYPRCAAPEPSDGEMYYLKIPHFLKIESQGFDPKAWVPPTTDHQAKTASENFSAYNTAISTIRWRRSPSNPSELQANARVLRWSDGSLTLQLASDPLTQYDIQARALAPPQQNPIKPTPLSHADTRSRLRPGQVSNLSQDTFTYLAQPYASPQVLRMTNKLTTALSIVTTGNTTDDALERLQRSMAAARAGTLADDGDFRPAFIYQDPEAGKKAAEQAEKEKLKAQRKFEQQQTREAVRMNKARDRVGLRGTGLTVGGLEDEGAARRGPGAARAKQRRGRHRDDWSDDEEEGEYEEDDFVAADDDEEEEDDAEGDSDDVDARIEARFREEKLAREQAKRAGGGGGAAAAPDVTRAVTPKRPAEDDDEGAGGDLSPGLNRHKRRRVVEEDDEEE